MKHKWVVWVSKSDSKRLETIKKYIQHKRLKGEFQDEELGVRFFCGVKTTDHLQGFINGYDVGRGAFVELT